MRKRWIFFPAAVLVLSFLGFYFAYFYQEEISIRGYFSSILSAVEGFGKDKLIRINLYNYSIALYENGALIKQAKISAAGHPTRAATPEGDFRVLSKEKSHISSLSGLIMPLSMRFYKGYFIHDLPLTRSGRPYNSEYSDGCIRLPSDLAKEVYQWADVGTKVKVYKAELVKSGESPMVYQLTKDGLKRHIVNPEAFIAHGFHWQDIAVIPEAEILNYPQGSLIE